jgi:hypothetical protein
MATNSYTGASPFFRAYLALCRQALEQYTACLIPLKRFWQTAQWCQVVRRSAPKAAPILARSMWLYTPLFDTVSILGVDTVAVACYDASTLN